MFVHRTHRVAAATLGVLGLGLAGCDDPVQSTDLRSEGPPNVLAVLVLTDAVGQLYETATYCRPNDEKRPSLVGLPDFTTQQVCPEDLSQGVDEVTNAYPDGWYVRIMFDELLDPSIEELTEIIDPDTGDATDTYTGSIANTKPVVLRCESVNGGMVNVDYDGYYSPSGNRLTWPVGPSIVVKPNDPTLVATDTQCEITINENVVDKNGNPVDAAQRGPYKFRIAPVEVLEIDPSDGATVDAALPYVDGVYVMFNTFVDPDSFCDEGTGMDECEFEFTPDAGGAGYFGNGYDHIFFTGDAVEVESEYTFQFIEGSKVKDRCGKDFTFGAPSEAAGTKISFKTRPFAYNRASIVSGETASPMKKLQLAFSNLVDPASFTTDDFTLTPAVDSVGVAVLDNIVQINGYFDINTEYTFTLNDGAVITDANGVDLTINGAKTITWKTQPAISVGFAPADNGTVTKPSDAAEVGVTLSFNAPMKGDDLVEGTEFTFESNGTEVTGFTVVKSGCGAASGSCSLAIRKNLAPGTYKFTLKAGATLEDQLGNVYTQANDRVINFTVAPPPPAPEPAPACL